LGKLLGPTALINNKANSLQILQRFVVPTPQKKGREEFPLSLKKKDGSRIKARTGLGCTFSRYAVFSLSILFCKLCSQNFNLKNPLILLKMFQKACHGCFSRCYLFFSCCFLGAGNPRKNSIPIIKNGISLFYNELCGKIFYEVKGGQKGEFSRFSD
jgi:hypothetical protein